MKFYFLLLILSINFCSSLLVTKIKDIQKDPKSFEEKKVTVEGRVTDKVGIFWREGNIYRIYEDGDNSIWVFTKKEKPERGELLRVTGIVKHGTVVANKIIGHVVSEEERVILEPGREK